MGLNLQVALFTRAWIERTIFVVFTPIFNVALFTRAWIERRSVMTATPEKTSRPLHEGVD